jgi:diguanylate cyclase (GGDEF)-like protein
VGVVSDSARDEASADGAAAVGVAGAELEVIRVTDDPEPGGPVPGVEAGVPVPDADAAVRATFAVLRELTGLPSWYLVAARGVPTVLDADDPVFPPAVGEVWPWPQLLDPRGLTGPEPVIRHAGQARVPAVVVALTVRAGDGVPYTALCGAAAEPAPVFPRGGTPPATLMGLLRHQARLLASLFEAEGRTARAQADALLDPLTRLANRRAWQRLLEREEVRCRRHGHPAGVIVVDIDGLNAVNRADGHAAGDDLLVRAATVLLRSSRGTDVVARLSGDRFAILASGATEGQMSALGTRLRLRLAGARVPASVGWASRRGHRHLADVWAAADRDMLRSKLGRTRGGGPLPG